MEIHCQLKESFMLFLAWFEIQIFLVSIFWDTAATIPLYVLPISLYSYLLG